jgi:hypothetical protein
MHTYFFQSKKVTLRQVQAIINKAGYSAANYVYTPMTDNGGYEVQGNTVMALTTLRNAAKQLNITVEITSAADSAGLVRGRSVNDGSPYSVTFTMDETTLHKMQGYSLVAFKGVKAPNTLASNAVPVAWFSSQDFGLSTTISWQEDYEAYTSTQSFIPQGTIDSSNSVPIAIGQSYNVDGSGSGTITNDGQPNAISINNTANREFTCGISQVSIGNDTPQPICAFDLLGGNVDIIIPEERVFLMFATGAVDTGVVLERSLGCGLLVDLTGVSSRTGISYDANQGWSWGNFGWANQFPPNYQLSPLLIDTSSTQVKKAAPARLVLAA